jgi:hypothetical protein
MRCSQLPLTSLFALCFCIFRCSAFGIRSPPPLHGDIAASQEECSGHLDGWQWNRCMLDGAVVWTAAAFGHMQVSNSVGSGFPSTMGSHVQYTPFSLEQPFAVSGDSLESQSIKQQLPPIVFALYIQSEVLQSSLWNSTMTCVLDAAIDKDHADLDLGWIDFRIFPRFRYNLASMPAHGNNGDDMGVDVLRFNSNIEYVTDNILLNSFGQMFSKQQASGVSMLNIEANIAPFVERSSKNQVPGPSLTWSIHFAVEVDGPNIPKSGSHEQTIGSPKRSFAKQVSHKMCHSAAYHQSKLLQHYNARMQTLSIWFESGTGKVSMNILSASVTHDRHGFAAAEFLVWFEVDGTCAYSKHIPSCASSSISKLNLSCSVFGHVVPAQIETKSLYGEPRESVVSCIFRSSAFSRDDHTVNVHLSDPSSNLQAVVPLCSLQQGRQIHRIVACSQAIYNADLLETRWPGILRAWVLYHARFPFHPRFCCK